MNTRESNVFEAISAGDIGRVRELIDDDPARAAVRDEDDLSAVTQASYRGHDAIVEVLLAAGPQLDVFEAATVGDLARVRELVEGDNDLVAAFSPDGYAALHLAAFFGKRDIVEFLLQRGADVHAVARNEMRVMPLHSAAAGRHLEIVRLLVDHGADVNATQERGFTPLHAAAQNGDPEMVRLLLDSGADLRPAAADGRRAVDFAAETGNEDVVRMLRLAEVG